MAHSPYAAWPNGKRLAVAITAMFEVWPEGKGPPNLVQRTQVRPGAVNHQAITWPRYAGAAAARAAPDGYTLLLANEALAINATLHSQLPFDARRDFAPVSLVVINPRVFVAHPSVGAQTMKDLIALAKKTPGAVKYGSSGGAPARIWQARCSQAWRRSR